MKRTVNTYLTLILISVFSLGSLNAQDMAMAEHKAKVAIIDFEAEIVDYGTITQNSDGLRVFTFTNTGDAPLLITNVKTSCGCTVPSYSKAPILPGQDGTLDIKYNTKKLGAFTKTITVISNAEGGNKILKIKGNVIASK
ncbi:DUF1573 domain-containing protein [Ichthyenterobacterium sp. W332]|uniref:DUF1573 domain-containing protein n=1 Tax=Microcosmobacter mediterraneus TaxID=3075607 RepID=A0ABU2YLP7_9FLAO|nr:DUF1573 domain-containing protein [Ichthyenterobacterium sp. W332]MDT0559085.1 DUF1573 domain-containing protein [Ichthyenterobacterium sp. W332]